MERISAAYYMRAIYCLYQKQKQECSVMLDHVSVWCKKWRLRINYAVFHFRNRGKQRSKISFRIGKTTTEYVSSYKYLGVVLHEDLDFNTTADTLFS